MKKLTKTLVISVVLLIVAIVANKIEQNKSFSSRQNTLREKTTENHNLMMQLTDRNTQLWNERKLNIANFGTAKYAIKEKKLSKECDKNLIDMKKLADEDVKLYEQISNYNNYFRIAIGLITYSCLIIGLIALILMINSKIGDWGATKEIGRKNSQIVFWLTGVIGIVIIVLSKDLKQDEITA